MKRLNATLGALIFVGLSASDVTWAHSWGGSRVGVQIVYGGPIGWPGYYRPYYAFPGYYVASPMAVYPSPVVVESSPPVYIERGSVGTSDAASAEYWYYCRKPRGYYPYVKECPGGWQEVAPQPSQR